MSRPDSWVFSFATLFASTPQSFSSFPKMGAQKINVFRFPFLFCLPKNRNQQWLMLWTKTLTGPTYVWFLVPGSSYGTPITSTQQLFSFIQNHPWKQACFPLSLLPEKKTPCYNPRITTQIKSIYAAFRILVTLFMKSFVSSPPQSSPPIHTNCPFCSKVKDEIK